MDGVDLSDLRGLRAALGMSQSKLAELVGASTRAIQSYEQGWRPTPLHVRKAAALMLFLRSRPQRQPSPPCWQVCNCPSQTRAACAAFQLGAGDLCWFLAGNSCSTGPVTSAEEKLLKCQKCPVMTVWLPPKDAGQLQPG